MHDNDTFVNVVKNHWDELAVTSVAEKSKVFAFTVFTDFGPAIPMIYMKIVSGGYTYGSVLIMGYLIYRPIYMTMNKNVWDKIVYLAI